MGFKSLLISPQLYLKNKEICTNNISITTRVFLIVVFFVFIMPLLEKLYSKSKEDFDNSMKQFIVPVKSKIDKLKCSKSCCNTTQWPVPHMEKNNHLETSLMCNRGDGSGCVCVKKEDLDFLRKNGGNK